VDGKLVSNSQSYIDTDLKRGEGNMPSAPLSYSETFYAQFPYYLSIGMTERQYWDRDCMLAKYYREAEKLRQEHRNYEMWLQGMYIYDGIQRLTPVLRAFPKKGTKPEPYVKEPYPITREEQARAQERAEQAEMRQIKASLEAWAIANNKKFEKKGKG